MTSFAYRAEVEEPDPGTPAKCGGCDWIGTAFDTTDIEECTLTPGDPSPVGRCPDPECGALAYIVKD